MKKTNNNISLPYSTVVEVVKFDLKGDFVGKKTMKLTDWQDFKRQKGFYYRAYQVGFCSLK